MNPWTQVVALSGGSAVAVGVIGFSVFRAVGRRSSLAASILVAATPVLAFTAGLIVVGRRMFLSSHDLRVALVVSLAAGAVSVGLGLALGARLQNLETDATEQHRRREVERTVEASRRDLMAWVSHDLRTPLAGLRAMTEALEDGVIDDPGRYYRRMRVEINHLTRMVDDLFELSRIQTGTLGLAPGPVAAADLVADALAAAEPIAHARGVYLDGEVAPGVRLNVDADEIQRALSNLVLNAIRHTTTTGSVVVSARQDGATSVISVRDGCGGIPSADLAHVFEVGWRGTQARSPGASEGAGLGLAIVRGIVAAHDGEVTVNNVPGGCEFAIRLP